MTVTTYCEACKSYEHKRWCPDEHPGAPRLSKPEWIELDVYEPNPEKPGYLRFVRRLTFREVYEQVKDQLEQLDLLPDEYFDIYIGYRYQTLGITIDSQVPAARWIAAYAVTGGSEGHYVHVDAIAEPSEPATTVEMRSIPMMLGKTFAGFEHATKIAGAISRMLA